MSRRLLCHACRTVLLNAACGVVMFSISTLTLLFLTGADGMMMPMFPGSALALVILWLAGLRVLPGVTVGLALSAILTGRVMMLPSVALGSVLEGIVGITLLRAVGFDVTLRRIRDAINLMVVVTTVGPLLTASITLATTYLFMGPLATPEAAAVLPPGMAPLSFALLAARFTWIADGVGTLLIAPTVLVWAGCLRRPIRLSRARLIEACVLGVFQLIALLVAMGIITDGPVAEEYLILPGLFWAALRFGPSGATLLTLLSNLAIIWLTLHGHGPYADESLVEPIRLQLFAMLAAASAFLLATTATERQQASEAAGRLRAESRFAELIEHITDMVLVVDAAGQIKFFNAAVTRVLGYSADELGALCATDLADPADLSYVRDATAWSCASGQPFVARARHKAGYWVPVESVITDRRSEPDIGGVIVTMRDITERQRTELELRNAQKLESVGRLAAGIAHEINTPIQFIGDNLHFLQAAATLVNQALGGVQSTEELAFLQAEMPLAIEQSLDGVQRVASIVRGLREFAQPATQEQQPADLNAALLSTLSVARHELDVVADVETELGVLPPVPCYLGDLNQVFLHLLVNAADAITARGSAQRGRIRATTRREGDMVLIEVSDTGCGIPESIRGQVFDPFFTTKDVGRGTGQGLALARSIVVDKHGGSIDFTTRVGHGTTFSIRLPLAGTERIPSLAEAA